VFGASVIAFSGEGSPSKDLAHWIPLLIALPALLLAGGASAIVRGENWLPVSLACGVAGVLFFLAYTGAPLLWWYWLGVVVLGALVSILGGFIARAIAHIASR